MGKQLSVIAGTLFEHLLNEGKEIYDRRSFEKGIWQK